VAEHAHDPLPRAPALLAQRRLQIGEHEKFMRQSALAKRASAYAPTTRSAGKTTTSAARLIDIVGFFESEIFRSPAREFVHRLSEQGLARAIDQTQTPIGSNVKTATSISAMIGAQECGRFRTRRGVAPAAFRRACSLRAILRPSA